MTRGIWKLFAAALLAVASASVLAAESTCMADVCNDPSWGEMRAAAPAILMATPASQEEASARLEVHVSGRVAAATVDDHLMADQLTAGDPGAVHAHPGSGAVASSR